MKKTFILIFLSFLITSCATSKLFTKGEIKLESSIEKLPFDFTSGIPLVVVNINGKDYNFLLDTGAPTVISNKIYDELNLKPITKNKISDSQNNKNTQIFTTLPEMKVGNMSFSNIGAVVIDFQASEFKCLELEGILGANQMAKAFWKINYDEQIAEITTDISNFDMTGFDYVFQFDPKRQKTPMIDGFLFDKKINFTFDTGFNGRIKLDKIPSEIDNNESINKIETLGSSTLGIYGKAESSKQYIFQTEEFKIENHLFSNEIISTGVSSLIGNQFLKDYIFVIDWVQNKIHLKKIKNPELKLDSFGFGYRFIDNKAIVTFIYNIDDFPLQLGDVVLSINETSMENLTQESECEIKANISRANDKTMKLQIKRNEEVLSFELNKTTLFSDNESTGSL